MDVTHKMRCTCTTVCSRMLGNYYHNDLNMTSNSSVFVIHGMGQLFRSAENAHLCTLGMKNDCIASIMFKIFATLTLTLKICSQKYKEGIEVIATTFR